MVKAWQQKVTVLFYWCFQDVKNTKYIRVLSVYLNSVIFFRGLEYLCSRSNEKVKTLINEKQNLNLAVRGAQLYDLIWINFNEAQ